MKKTMYISTVFVLVAALTLLAAPVMAADEPAAPAEPVILKAGAMLPEDVKVTSMDGTEMTLKSLLGDNYTIVQFMTTACSACQAELVELLKIKDMNPGSVDLFAISMDLLGADAVNAYEERYDYGITYFLDSMFAVPPRFGFTSTPAFVVLDNQGKILYAKRGFLASKWQITSDEIQALF